MLLWENILKPLSFKRRPMVLRDILLSKTISIIFEQRFLRTDCKTKSIRFYFSTARRPEPL